MNRFPVNRSSLAVLFRRHPQLVLTVLVGCQLTACCVSLGFVADLYRAYQFVLFNKALLSAAILNVLIFATVSTAFIFAKFSIGYLLGFYFYNMIAGYLWLVTFSRFNYDHLLAGTSAFLSAVAFLLPTLFITSPIKQVSCISERALDAALHLIIAATVIVLAIGASHHFRLVDLTEIYSFRDEIDFPPYLRYAIGMTLNALLPFAFACLVERGNRWRAILVLVLMLLHYPIALTKIALFAPFWLLCLMLMSRYFEARVTIVLTLLLPTTAGVILLSLFNIGVLPYGWPVAYFGAVNFRMIAVPSIALDYYNDFFSTHPPTYFCQISFLRVFVECLYDEPLSIMMAKAYRFGNLNASLFATEGVASVGTILAPLAVFVCGLLVCTANRVSAGLPPRFILLSSGILPQILLNVPLTTTLVTNGAALLFLLWYITPRTAFYRSIKMTEHATSLERS